MALETGGKGPGMGGVPGVPGVELWRDAVRGALYVVDMDAVDCEWIGNDAVTEASSSVGALALLVMEAEFTSSCSCCCCA